jgi:hypothetical protein
VGTSRDKVIESYGNTLAELFKKNEYVVFLCGPKIDREEEGAKLRKKIKELLEEENFKVYLGEDEGLEDLQNEYGMDAQLNEVEFINSKCNAVIVIAGSVGSFCELGLFSYLHSNWIKTDLILVVEKKHQGKESYFNLGPAKSVESTGKVIYEEFNGYNGSSIIERLKQRRATYVLDARGRPRKEH